MVATCRISPPASPHECRRGTNQCGEVKESPRKEFLYWSDDGDLFAIRALDWKISFSEQYHQGQAIWDHEYTRLRLPNIYNLH